MDLNISLLNNEINEIETGLSEMLDKYIGYVENTLLQEEIMMDLREIRL